MTDHITEKKVESEGKVFNKNRGKTVSKSKVFQAGTSMMKVTNFLWNAVEYGKSDHVNKTSHKYTVTITKHLD